MLKKEITYTNPITSVEETGSFYFHLDPMDIVEINLIDDIKEVGRSKDPKRILPALKRITRAAVGHRIGSDFVKNEQYADVFIGSGAYSALYMELLQGDEPENKIAEFIKAVIPQNLPTAPQDHLPGVASSPEAQETPAEG